MAARASDGIGVGLLIWLLYTWVGFVVWTVGGWLYVHASRRGKHEVWAEVLDDLDLRGDEHALDLGCGRGAVTVALASRLPRGGVDGVDLWRSVDQSGNDPSATRRNLAANGVPEASPDSDPTGRPAGAVALHTADMTRLPFHDHTFDLVTAGLAIHNVPTAQGRADAVREALRVLRPGGRLVVVDISRVREYATVAAAAGAHVETDRGLGWRLWWSGPWMATRLLVVRR
ncbi:type 11 methyltransferase [Luteimicrobium album]|uniref:Type 11 methyltransferase n=1 Tax=Luteimicrobium album TaxID=1054550 RepID=A0ABQ6I5C5_9MICO|nr:class I SAM-dependent methyltransferase [Luteimicrobium album]GMA25024.1 type 11 methyltransferase [Luteimicrobium album]